MPSTDILSLSAAAAAQEIARGAMSAEDYLRAHLDRIDQVEPEVQAFAHFDADYAIEQAKALDEHRMQGRALGPLHGVPVAIKDIVDTRDFPTEFGSTILAGRRPPYDAAVVTKLRAAGAVIIGKTVTTEFAYYNPGKTRNPHDTGRTPGGSSSGSAAAVAAGMAPLSIGSQTNGSIIRPAAYCGVFALKPSHGLVSRSGILPLSQVLDHIGPFARNLDDLALIMETLAGHDADDEDTRTMAVPSFRKAVGEDYPLPPRFAFVRSPIWSQADDATKDAFERLATELGEHCVDFDLSADYANAWDAIRIIMLVDMSHRFGPLAERHGDLVSKVLRDLIEEGRTVAGTRYLAALDLRKSFAERLNAMFSQFNAILTPAAPGVAPKGHSSTGSPAFCSLWTLTGLPAMAVPLLEGEHGMPLGVQLVGARGDDYRLFRTAKWLIDERAPKPKKRGRKR